MYMYYCNSLIPGVSNEANIRQIVYRLNAIVYRYVNTSGPSLQLHVTQ